MIKVLGIDQSSNFGWAVGHRGMKRPVWGVVDLPKPVGREGVMFHRAYYFVLELIAEHKITHCFFEETIKKPTDKLSVLWQQIGLATHVQSACVSAGIPSQQVLISDWHKRFIGKTKSPPGLKGQHSRQWWKDQAVKSCFERGWLTDDDNAADALGIMDYGLCCTDPKYTQETDALFRRAEDRGTS